MELEFYQIVFILTTLFSGSDERPATASTQTAIVRPKQFDEYSRIAQVEKSLDHVPSGQGMFHEKHLLTVEKELQAKIKRLQVIKRLKQNGQLRKEFFFPSKTANVSPENKLPHVEITSKTKDYLGGLIRRKAAAKFKKLRRGRARCRRYVKQGSRWAHDTITWTIPSSGWSGALSNNEVNKTLTKAFRLWAEVSPLQFRWVDPPTSVDINIKFASGSHGGHPDEDFDGPGQVLAHAFYPNVSGGLAGDIHFDDDEPWVTTSSSNPNDKQLLPVAVHEIGHSLGLRHSPVPGSIMNEYYSNQVDDVILSDDDVSGIQDIYGRCNPRVTAIEIAPPLYKTVIFNADKFWFLSSGKTESDRGYPREISSKWQNVPNDIDEIFIWGHNWQVYFFKGSEYYRYDHVKDKVAQGYPLPISQGWPGLPDGIDAAMTFSDSNSYFFKGNLVYMYDNANDQVMGGYPKNISDVWPGLPNNLDSAFRRYPNGITYFFKDEFYWVWNDQDNNATGPLLIRDTWKNICNV